MVEVMNPFAGAAIGADFEWHTEHGYQGGTDYKVGPDQLIRAACDGVVHRMSESEIALDYGPSRFINYREVKELVGKFPRAVKRDDVIGKTGNEWGGVVRWPHIDRTVSGVRLPFEPAVTSTPSKPADGGTAVPISSKSGDDDMFQFQKKSGSRWFVHPDLTVEKISDTQFSANLAVGIRTQRNVDNTKGERFRKAHNARVLQLNPGLTADALDDLVEGVLDGLNISDAIATDVSDAVYAKLQKGGVTLTKDTVKQIAKSTIGELTGQLAK